MTPLETLEQVKNILVEAKEKSQEGNALEEKLLNEYLFDELVQVIDGILDSVEAEILRN